MHGRAKEHFAGFQIQVIPMPKIAEDAPENGICFLCHLPKNRLCKDRPS
jgi:hypothetical protein